MRPCPLGTTRRRLEAALGRCVPFADVAEALAAGFAEALNLNLVRGELTAGERALVADLRRSRYADTGWTHRA